MKEKIFIILFSLGLVGCATAHKISRVQIGMTKEDVIWAMGKPTSISAQGDTEYLNYSLSETSDQAFYGLTQPYYVRIVNGIVDSYGRLGDFDSTKDPTVNIKSETKFTSDSKINSTNKADLYTELKKLKQLQDDGIITQKEFDKEKQELLEKY